ncbi:MAG: hypothetical protein PHR36_01995 [Patescibacteria group bacterium]|nr:hypothetical protein [Patescibacteria group bacterium]
MNVHCVITAEMTIGEIVRWKGMRAGELMDEALCDNGEKACCPGVSLQLGYAAHLKGKEAQLPGLIEKLNQL